MESVVWIRPAGSGESETCNLDGIPWETNINIKPGGRWTLIGCLMR